MPLKNESYRDPRNRLVREKYFCIRPRPLERWLWSHDIPASAERVFWLHWQEGMQRGDWCSELSLRYVARECDLDVSTVTRAYQILVRIGCVRRTDPGRNPANPFQQATAITEVRLPKELLLELDRYPSRETSMDRAGDGRAIRSRIQAPDVVTAESAAAASQAATSETAASKALENAAPPAPFETTPEVKVSSNPNPPLEAPGATDPFPDLRGRERAQALSKLLATLSAQERHRYQEALRQHHSAMDFDTNSTVPSSVQARIMQTLQWLAAQSQPANAATGSGTPIHMAKPASRKLSLFELARLNRTVQSVTSTAAAPELTRQVVWSIETGALRRFDTRHALNIAMKKIREGLWTRPNRMPPNWARPEACSGA